MATTIPVPGAPGLLVRLRRHARARQLSLRVSRIDGAVSLTVPPGVGQADMQRFLADQAGWLARVRDGLPDRVTVAPGAMLPLRGAPMKIVQGAGRSVVARDGCLLVPGPAGRMAARLRAFLIGEARAESVAAAMRHASALGRPAPPVRLADPRGRWGSCTADGRLMLSWRLILAPPTVFDYVVAHEAAHLVEMNHSPAFWAVVAGLYPDHARARAWLKAEGAGLHRFDFRPRQSGGTGQA